MKAQRAGTSIAPPTEHGGPTYQQILDRDSTPAPAVLRLQQNPPQPCDDIPVEHFISPEFFQLELSRMWSRVWQFVCRDENLAEVGDYWVYEIGRYSIVVVRASPTALKAYHNSCLHRGTRLKPPGNGFTVGLQCPFHGWTWSLDGTLETVPCAWEFPHLDYEANRLPEVRVETWNGFVFINLDPAAPPLLDYLEVLPEHFSRWSFTGWHTWQRVEKELACNWKVALEAFMEAYHTPLVHPEMTHVVGDWNMQHDLLGEHISRDLCPLGVSSPTSTLGLSEQDLLDRGGLGDPGNRRAATVPPGGTARTIMAARVRERFRERYGIDLSDLSDAECIDSLKYNIFPNTILYGGRGLAQIQQFLPIGMDPDRCLMVNWSFRPVAPDEPRPAPAEAYRLGEADSFTTVPGSNPFSGQVLDQDTSILRWQQEGLHASAKGAITLSTYQESRIRHLHTTLRRYVERP